MQDPEYAPDCVTLCKILNTPLALVVVTVINNILKLSTRLLGLTLHSILTIFYLINFLCEDDDTDDGDEGSGHQGRDQGQPHGAGPARQLHTEIQLEKYI